MEGDACFCRGSFVWCFCFCGWSFCAVFEGEGSRSHFYAADRTSLIPKVSCESQTRQRAAGLSTIGGHIFEKCLWLPLQNEWTTRRATGVRTPLAHLTRSFPLPHSGTPPSTLHHAHIYFTILESHPWMDPRPRPHYFTVFAFIRIVCLRRKQIRYFTQKPRSTRVHVSPRRTS